MKPRATDFRDLRLLVCLGPGGVGKTTLSAALGVRGSRLGRRVALLTVDPTARLLNTLGLDPALTRLQEVPLDTVRGPRPGNGRRGRLRAMKLDPKLIFDSLVLRHASSPSAAEKILEDRIYRNLSSALAGIGDYMAMEQLLELYGDQNNDLVVLDTPPATEALQFLESPRRLIDLLNSRAAGLLGASGRFVRRRFGIVDVAARAVLRAFDRLTGLHLLGDVETFVRRFEGMYSGFAERAERASALLGDRRTGLLVVTTAEAGRVAETRDLIAGLHRTGLNPRAVVINRMMAPGPDGTDPAVAGLPPSLRRKLKRNLEDFSRLRKREAAALEELRAALPQAMRLISAPDLEREPATILDLKRLGRCLREI